MSGTWTPGPGATSGDDSFTAAPGGSASDGLGGNDTLIGGTGADTLSGSDGNGSIQGALLADLLSGGTGSDTISGGAGDDTIEGGAGADNLAGLTGSDVLSYASDTAGVTVDLVGAGQFFGSGGDAAGDTLSGFVHIFGGTGNDSLAGTSAANTLVGAGGNDTLFGDDGADTLIGGDGNDSMQGAVAADSLDGGASSDTLLGGDGADTLVGGDGSDSLVGDASADSLSGGAGNDTILSGPTGVSADTLLGGDGSDVLIGSNNDYLDFGAGNDSLTYADSMGSMTLDGGAGTDRLTINDLSAWSTVAGAGGFTTYSKPGTNLQVRNFEQIVCFAEGTRIMSAKGEVPVEALRVGDQVLTIHGGRAALRPVVWLGHSHVDIAHHPRRQNVAPIRIRAGAMGQGVPHRDLRVSPEHALFLDGRLVTAHLLVNGTSIVQELWVREITYWHVELLEHGLLISDGAVTESYFDDGNRKQFDNYGDTTLFKDFARERPNGRYSENACYPLVQDGLPLESIRARIAARAPSMPASDGMAQLSAPIALSVTSHRPAFRKRLTTDEAVGAE